MASTDSEQEKVTSSLQETSKKVEASVVTAIASHLGSHEFAKKDGLDFLDVKNSLLLSYLIDIVSFIRDKGRGIDNEKSLERLTEMKIVLDKMQGVDKKLRYQIDKLLASSTGASTFAVGAASAPDDPLQFRPDPKALEADQRGSTSSASDSDDESQEGPDYGRSGGTEGTAGKGDDDLKAARETLSLSKEKKNPRKEENDDGVYRAPRMAAVPYGLDQEHKQKEKEKRARRRLRATELAQTLRAQYGDAPEQEDVHGGSDYGKQRSAARRLAEREAEKTKYEEDTMVRLQTSRKDKKEKKRLMRQEGSNLDAIANLGNLVRETREFGRDQTGADWTADNSPKESRYENGKRRREEINVDGKPMGRKSGKMGKAKNSLQAALYDTGRKAASRKSRR